MRGSMTCLNRVKPPNDLSKIRENDGPTMSTCPCAYLRINLSSLAACWPLCSAVGSRLAEYHVSRTEICGRIDSHDGVRSCSDSVGKTSAREEVAVGAL